MLVVRGRGIRPAGPSAQEDADRGGGTWTTRVPPILLEKNVPEYGECPLDAIGTCRGDDTAFEKLEVTAIAGTSGFEVDRVRCRATAALG